MLAVIRYPLGGAVSLVALLTAIALVVMSVGDDSPAVRDGNHRVREILASSAPLIASDLAGFQERRRREGRGYARDTEGLVADWLRQFDAKDRRRMREWTRYHGVDATGTASGFVVETSSAPDADGWYRLEVERRAGRVTATCGGAPATGCRDGHWRIERHGLIRRYLLGR